MRPGTFRPVLHAVCACSLLASLPSCTLRAGAESAPPAEEPAETEDRPRPEDMLLIEADDRAVGERAAKEVEQQLGLVEDAVLLAWIDAVGQRVAAQAPRDFEYHFQIVDQEVPNAFALPGGWIFLTRGLLILLNSEDELANVLGHEITHVAERHAAREKALSRAPQLWLPSVMSGVDLAGDQLGGSREAWMARYQRGEEAEADRYGQEYAAAAGWDPRGLSRFLRSLENAQRLATGTPRMPSFLDSHPASPSRLTAASTQGSTLVRKERPGIAPKREQVLARLEGLVVGPDPREGVFFDSLFVQPLMDLALRFPDGWTTVNTHAAVGATAPARDEEVVLEVEQKGDDPKAAAESFFAKPPEGVKLNRRGGRALTLAGRPAWSEEVEVIAGKQALKLDLVWIVHGEYVFRITAASRKLGNRFAAERAIDLARSFRAPTRRELDAITVSRLRIARARAGESLAALSARTGNTWKPMELRVVNGLLGDEPLAEDQAVKIAVEEPWEPPPAEEGEEGAGGKPDASAAPEPTAAGSGTAP